MGSFTASLKTVGDREGLPATLRVQDGRLHIAAGDSDIGEWDLDEIRLEPTPNGYRLAAEGEQILIEMPETDEFATEISNASKRKSLFRGMSLPLIGSKNGSESGKDETEPPASERPKKPGPAEVSAPPARPAADTVGPIELDARQDEKAPRSGRIINMVDGTIASAERRWGSLLPRWVFTRVVFGIVVGTVVAAALFPGLVATILLLSGVLMVTFGAIVYSDNMLASRWLPGRTTPIHALLFGVAILMLGVLLAAIAG
jgi:hypothetical protein